jgi:hypothetical protein
MLHDNEIVHSAPCLAIPGVVQRNHAVNWMIIMPKYTLSSNSLDFWIFNTVVSDGTSDTAIESYQSLSSSMCRSLLVIPKATTAYVVITTPEEMEWNNFAEHVIARQNFQDTQKLVIHTDDKTKSGLLWHNNKWTSWNRCHSIIC